MKHTHIHTLTLRHTPPFSQSAYTNSKPEISGNNAFSVKPKTIRINKAITITIYFINPNGKLKLSFDRTTKNISQ